MIKVEQIFALINEQRAKAGACPLNYRADISPAANLRAQESSTVWSHNRPDGSPYYSADDRIYGENLSKFYDKAEDIVTAWMNSESHKRNILDPKYKGACVGVYEQNGKLWVSLEFTL